MFGGLTHSEVFGNVISLSGSFWWKPEGETQGGWLIRQLEASPKLPLSFYLEVGLMESYSRQIDDNRLMAQTLTAKGYPVHYSEYDGGHSFLNWSQGMANGLQYVFGMTNAAKGTLPQPKGQQPWTRSGHSARFSHQRGCRRGPAVIDANLPSQAGSAHQDQTQGEDSL